MNSETKICQNCRKSFVIDPEDFEFYQKIDVPPPTFCPPCRFQRRVAWVNTFNLYKRPCDLCKKRALSVYAPEAPYTVYCPKCWWSDAWDPHAYAMEYDSRRPFLEQFGELLRKAPLLGLSVDIPTSENSPYSSNSGNLKNCYLLYKSNDSQDSAYGFYVLQSSSLVDSSVCMQTEWLYDSMHSWKCNRCVGSRSYVIESYNSYFLKDCINCHDCFGCANLKNKQFCIFNEQLTKEEYLKRVAAHDLGSYAGYKKAQADAEAFWKTQMPKAEFGGRNANCRGAHIYDSKNVRDSFQVNQLENGRYVQVIDPPGPNTELYDVSFGRLNQSLSYESSMAGIQSSRIKFSQESGIGGMDIEYCKAVISGNSNCFGCVGMKKARYCILNKQYSPKEYGELVQKIKTDMNDNPYIDARGRAYRYGEFFPIEFSPHAYNETLAQNFFPLSKEQAEQAGYRWRDDFASEYAITVTADALPDHIKDAKDSLLNEVIGCESCGRGFKMISMELKFLREMNVPLPRRCPFCRVQEKFKLWMKNTEQHERVCSQCGAEFISKYTEREAPKVLCARCYARDVA